MERAAPQFQATAPWNLQYNELARLWGEHCIVMDTPSAVVCTCPMMAAEGHCPHKYAVEELANKRTWRGHQIAAAAEGAEALRRGDTEEPAAGSSADEAPLEDLRHRGRL